MTTALAANSGFDFDLKAILPRLRIYAMSLTRDGDRADDLVQQTAMKALAGRKSFQPGTNFAGWIFRIEHNEFISELRRTRPTVDIDTEISSELSVRPRQEDGFALREFVSAFRQLPKGGRQALLMAQLTGYSHEQISRHAGIALGTVKSRISRGRTMLAHLLAPAPDLPRSTHNRLSTGSTIAA